MKQYTRICARINLDAIEHNIEKIKNKTGRDTKIMAVIKSDGYGHGAYPVAKFLEPDESIWGYAIATLDYAVSLKRLGIKKPILVLGCVFPDQYTDMLEYGIQMPVYTLQMAQEVSDIAVKMGRKAYIHIKLDTGMSRLGFPVNEESMEEIVKISQMPNLVMEGMFTHFARADEADKTFTEQQLKQYRWMKKELEDRNITFSYYHCSNSAGIIDLDESDLNLVRAGIAVYGLYPSEEVKKDAVPLWPAMELISHVAHVKWVDPGTPVSYGGTCVTNKRTQIATIPMGYGDGYPRSLSNKGYVLIHGKQAPILGRVCMDQMMVDTTEIEDVQFGDQVTLIGRSGEEYLPVEVLSDLSGRFNYEFMCDLSKRIPREYLRHGEVVEQVDYFN